MQLLTYSYAVNIKQGILFSECVVRIICTAISLVIYLYLQYVKHTPIHRWQDRIFSVGYLTTLSVSRL
jgi:hypothetical protein